MTHILGCLFWIFQIITTPSMPIHDVGPFETKAECEQKLAEAKRMYAHSDSIFVTECVQKEPAYLLK